MGSIVVATAIVAGLFVGAPGATGDTGNPPDFLRKLGGPLHAEMYPSGMEVAPDGTIVIADTGNDQVAKYTRRGRELWRIGSPGSGRNRFSDPRDIGIDARGRIYVADADNGRIVKLSPQGRWLKAFEGPAGAPLGIPIGVTVRDNVVYVTDSASSRRIRLFTRGGRQFRAFTDPGSGTCDLSAPRDVDADPQGNIYIANYTLHNVVKISPTGACLTQWATGTISTNTPYGIRLAKDPVLDARLVYVALGNEDTIEVFRLNGTQVGSMGGQGGASQPGTFDELRRVAVAADGDVWGVDLWGWRLERFNRTAGGWSYAQRIGDPLPAATSRHVFHDPHQVAFEANGTVAIVDTVHHRFVRMTPGGQILSICGQRGSAIGQYNWPRGIAVDPVTGHLWVANTKQYNIHIIRTDTCGAAPPAGGVQSRFGSQGTGLDQFNWPHSIVIRGSDADRVAFIADTNNHRIVAYHVATRTPITSFGSSGSGNGNFRFPTAVALDPATGNLFVADSGNDRIVELSVSADGGSFTWEGTYTGGFSGPQGVALDPQGRIFVADTANDRLVILRPSGTRLGTVTGLSGPESVSVDPSGRIYVSDTYADRVRVYQAYAA